MHASPGLVFANIFLRLKFENWLKIQWLMSPESAGELCKNFPCDVSQYVYENFGF